MKSSEGKEMRRGRQRGSVWIGLAFLGLLCGILFDLPQEALARHGFDVKQMSDMSDFDPNHPVIPTGDTIRIGLINTFSGSWANMGEYWWIMANWVAHDINKRGGIFVDGKWKKVQLIKGDIQNNLTMAKEVAERLCLEKKVHILWGTPGSHLALVIQQVAGKYKVVFVNDGGLSDALMNGKNFNRYAFRVFWNTTMAGQSVAYFLSQRPERKFYILCQDYLFGHDLAEAFKEGLKKYKPAAEIVGEDYHPLFAKDFAPYLTKIKGSKAEVIFTGDMDPDASNLLKQARELGIKLPFANIFVSDPHALLPVGPAGTIGLLHVDQFLLEDDTPEHRAWLRTWNEQWKKWKKPYNAPTYKWPSGHLGAVVSGAYWLMDIIRRAGSTDPERIIQTWEGDEWNSIVGPVKMRACDHQAVMDLFAAEFVYPNKWFEDFAYYGKIGRIPAKYVTPPVAEDLERCRK
jgi:branched-chain amino acid transport system substrate-binding protein